MCAVSPCPASITATRDSLPASRMALGYLPLDSGHSHSPHTTRRRRPLSAHLECCVIHASGLRKQRSEPDSRYPGFEGVGFTHAAIPGSQHLNQLAVLPVSRSPLMDGHKDGGRRLRMVPTG